MRRYNRSICSTCRYLEDCALTSDKRFITYCSDYEHEKQQHTSPFEGVSDEDNYDELIFI